ncbi:MAG: hypothetical protein ACLRM8_07590 [Alistipes sp.]
MTAPGTAATPSSQPAARRRDIELAPVDRRLRSRRIALHHPGQRFGHDMDLHGPQRRRTTNAPTASTATA